MVSQRKPAPTMANPVITVGVPSEWEFDLQAFVRNLEDLVNEAVDGRNGDIDMLYDLDVNLGGYFKRLD